MTSSAIFVLLAFAVSVTYETSSGGGQQRINWARSNNLGGAGLFSNGGVRRSIAGNLSGSGTSGGGMDDSPGPPPPPRGLSEGFKDGLREQVYYLF